MNIRDFNRFINDLDASLSNLDRKAQDSYIKDSFPPYNHIGKYYDPRDTLVRDYFEKQLNSDLNSYSFDPLLSFEMNQVKYSHEVLHPECKCFRRSRIKKRPIKTCSHRDRILFAGWNFYLSELHKVWLTDNRLEEFISAYVPNTGKFNADHAKKAFDYIQEKAEYSARAIDVRSFFDKIPHNELRSNLIKLIRPLNSRLDKVNFKLFKSVTNYSYIDLNELKAHLNQLTGGVGMYFSRENRNWEILRDLKIIKKNNTQGIPQGLACSGVLANIAMMNVDNEMVKEAQLKKSLYLRYADDIFIASTSTETVESLLDKCVELLGNLKLPIADEKTEKFDFDAKSKSHPELSYLGLKCRGNQIGVRMNGVNKFYKRTSQFIYSYVLTCKKRGIKPSRKKIRAIFSHSGSDNYYSYLRRASVVFENDERYHVKGIKGTLKNHLSWIDQQFDDAINTRVLKNKGKYISQERCNCPLQKDKK